MAGYQKLIKGALEKLAAWQAEARAQGMTTEELITQMQKAQSKFAGQTPEGGLKLYHGSPHEFEKFDFENNLKRGEGALAYGPGGYLTGHKPLAEAYARNLSGRLNTFAMSHGPMLSALKADPQATAEYLRMVNFKKIMDAGFPESGRAKSRELTLPDRDRYDYSAAPTVVNGRVEVEYPVIPAKHPDHYILTERDLNFRDFDRYGRAIEDIGLDPRATQTRIGRGGIDPSEARRIGAELRKRIAPENIDPAILRGRPRELSRPAVEQGHNGVSRDQLKGLWDEVVGFNRSNNSSGDISDPVRNNLNNTSRFLRGETGKIPYKASMQRSVDLNNLPSEHAPLRNLYETDLLHPVEDLLPYDYPFSTASPKVLGALSQLTAKYPGLAPYIADPTVAKGADLVEALRKGAAGTKDPQEQMRALRESGIPAMYYLRGRRSGAEQVPDLFKPDDYNFVTFDDLLLPPPRRTQFAKGGAVK